MNSRIIQGVCVVCNKNQITERYNPTCSDACQNKYRGLPEGYKDSSQSFREKYRKTSE